MLLEREAAGRPVTLGLIGAGKFGTMFLAQARRTPGLHVVGIADLSPARAHAHLAACGWEPERHAAGSLAAAWRSGATCVTEDAGALLAEDGIEVVVEST